MGQQPAHTGIAKRIELKIALNLNLNEASRPVDQASRIGNGTDTKKEQQANKNNSFGKEDKKPIVTKYIEQHDRVSI